MTTRLGNPTLDNLSIGNRQSPIGQCPMITPGLRYPLQMAFRPQMALRRQMALPLQVPLRRTAALAILSLALAAPAPPGSTLPEAAARAVARVTPDRVRTYVTTLASDDFGGRGLGEPGNRAAEEYICKVLQENGVPPAGANATCYQPVAVYRPSPGTATAFSASFEDGRPAVALTVSEDLYPLPDSGNATVSGPLVFADHGISAPDRGHDDYAGVNARDAIVLLLDGGPANLREYATLRQKIAQAAAHGARGVLLVSDHVSDDRLAWPDQSASPPVYRLLSEWQNAPPIAALSEAAARPIRRALAEGVRVTGTLTPALPAEPVMMHNVLGMIEGRDPSRRGEMVVVGAHMDHDGTDTQGRIFNGADDNASGTAAVLAAAAAFARAAAGGERPARAVLFALWNGEEKGSLGAEAFVRSPQPARRVIANLNLDMVGRHEEIPDPGNWRFAGLPKVQASASVNTLHVLGYSIAPDLAAELRDANGAVGLTLLEDYDVGAQDLLKRSDNWPFVEHGIPALFLTTGLHPDYHTPDDDTARIDFGKLARVAQLAARAAWIVADGPAPALKKR
jgi:hypothetical protein